MVGMRQRSPSRPWRSTWTQIHRLAPCLRSFSSRRRFSSKRARRRSSRRSRRAPSVEACREFPHPPVARVRASRLMSHNTPSCPSSAASRICDHRVLMCAISMAHGRVSHWWVRRVVGRERARVTGVLQRRPRARPLVSSHVRTCARHDNRDDDDDHAEFEIRIAITMVTTNSAYCPSQAPSPSPMRARSQVRSRRGTVTDAAAAAQHTAVAVVISGRPAARWRARYGSGG